MKIGIDIQCLGNTGAYRAGMYYYVLGLLGGLSKLESDSRISLYVSPWDRNAVANVKRVLADAGVSFPVKQYAAARGRPYRLRNWLASRWSGFGELDAFQFMSCESYPQHGSFLKAFLIPDLTTIHFPEYHEEANVKSWESLFALAKSMGDKIITYSEHTRRDAIGVLGLDPERVIAIPIAADAGYIPMGASECTPLLSEHMLRYKQYFLSVGTLEPRKNYLNLLEAYARYKQAIGGEAIPLVIVGGLGWKYQAILDEPARLGISDHVRFLGRVKNVAAIYNGARFFVYPSRFEGFGLPPLEAMSCGIPTIASNASSLPEVVGDAGILIDPDDVDSFADAFCKLTVDVEYRNYLMGKSVERAKNFSWTKTARLHLHALGEGRNSTAA